MKFLRDPLMEEWQTIKIGIYHHLKDVFVKIGQKHRFLMMIDLLIIISGTLKNFTKIKQTIPYRKLLENC